MKNILMNVKRPGDFFNWMAVFCHFEEEFKRWPGKIYITENALYYPPNKLLPNLFTDDRFAIVKHRSALKDIEYVDALKHFTFDGEPMSICYNFPKLFNGFSAPELNRVDDAETINCVITIECEKRRFISQLELLVDFCKLVEEQFAKKVHFINSGLTSTLKRELLPSQVDQFNFEENYLDNLSRLTGCSYENLWGESIPNKLDRMVTAHCAISATGTAALLPNMCKLPSLTFGNAFIHRIGRKRGVLGPREKLIPISKTTAHVVEPNFINRDFKVTAQLESYDIAPNIYRNYLKKFLNRLV